MFGDQLFRLGQQPSAIKAFAVHFGHPVCGGLGSSRFPFSHLFRRQVDNIVAAINCRFAWPSIIRLHLLSGKSREIHARIGINDCLEVIRQCVETAFVHGKNKRGCYNVMTHAARRMMEMDPLDGGERGVIINTSSVAYQDGQLGQAAYAASKGAIASMCLPAARRICSLRVRVMAIAPGLFHTPMMEGLPEETTAEITKNIPFPDRLGTPDEYALLAQQIISNPYLNGTTIRIDGAVRLPPR